MSFVPSTQFTNSSQLRSSRLFPEDLHQLTVEINRAYTDIASAVNNRTVGLFPINKSIAGGEKWYVVSPQAQGQFRQVYTFTSFGSIPHGVTVSQIYGFVRIWGTFTDGTNWYPLPYVDVVAATNQVNIVVSATDIVITAGAGAPSVTRGTIVLEWISNP
jgi:hypothetical protein